jgi:hypothetical protein
LFEWAQELQRRNPIFAAIDTVIVKQGLKVLDEIVFFKTVFFHVFVCVYGLIIYIYIYIYLHIYMHTTGEHTPPTAITRLCDQLLCFVFSLKVHQLPWWPSSCKREIEITQCVCLSYTHKIIIIIEKYDIGMK